ncbi:MAG TPA: PEP/pyruvate-binding domain-containing protein [Polyangiaceae bacterium]|nr:PEP/pyruvate-binding domain-containing protein [Polyangiaceae bacterium]
MLRYSLGLALLLVGCSGKHVSNQPPTPPADTCGYSLADVTEETKHHRLRVNEVMTANDGAWVDEYGETDDFVELINTGSKPLDLADYALSDKSGEATQLPELTLEPGKTVLVWADKSPDQGALHLPFKLSSSGTPVLLWAADTCELVDKVEVPELPTSESYARLPDGDGDFSICRYATPERENGETCDPPEPPNLSDDVTFAPYAWELPFPKLAGPLVLSELALHPAAFVEVLNASDKDVKLSDFELRLAPLPPGTAPPGAAAGTVLAWPADATTLAAGERLVVPVTSDDTADLEATPELEGVVAIWQSGESTPSDRLDFMAWPEGASLARVPDDSGYPRFCETPSPGAANKKCKELATRELIGGRAHHLATIGDFDRLAEGGTEVGDLGVKFVVDMNAGDVVHLLGTRDWALHYTWIREQIEGQSHLDRCDPAQSHEFDVGWGIFSQNEYFRVEGRRYLLGTLVTHPNGSKTVEYTPGDVISGEQMRRAFFDVMGVVEDPTEWAIRPTEGRQIAELRKVEGTVPIVGPNAPYVGLTYQPLNPAVGFGTLTYVPARDLETAELGPNVIVVTDDVPNGTAFTGGLITEAFQTPLAHVNVLARGRGTPNMALRNARTDERVAGFFGKLVRLEVRATDFNLREATAAEADEFWQARVPKGDKVAPVRDLSVRGVVTLADVDYSAITSVGSKAAGIAELLRVSEVGPYCPSTSVPLFVPPHAFAIPFVHYVEHFQNSGAEALLTELEQDPQFRADPATHADGLAQVRQLMLDYPVDEELVAAVKAQLEASFGDTKVRFRSSSNTEDLATFNGAGLHTSTSADLEGNVATVQDALRTVWSSLWNTRAYDERDFGNVDQSLAAMAVLVHQAWQEQAQGVAISRNALHATRDSQYYINAQIGEASVTNPAPGVTSDEIVYTPPPRRPQADYQAHSSLSHGRDVLSFLEIQALGCALESIHTHFHPLIDPDDTNRLYAMQIEWKLIGPERRLLVKQARPYNFGELDAPTDCREF